MRKIEIWVSTLGFIAFLCFVFTHSWLHLLAGGLGFGYSYGLLLRNIFKKDL